MKKLYKYFAIIVPLFAAFGIQIGVGIVGALIYYLFRIASVFFSRCKMIENGSVPFNMILNEVLSINNSQEIMKILSKIATIVSIVVFYYWIKRYNRTDIGLNLTRLLTARNISLMFLLGMGCQFLEVGVSNLIFSHFESISRDYNNTVSQFLDGNQIIVLLEIVLLAPISEELIFRGVMFTKARRIFPFIGANILQATLFSLYHMNIIQGVNTFIAGLLLGYVAYRYETIVASIILHMFLNIISYFIIINYPSYTLYCIYTAMGIVLLVIILKRIKKLSNRWKI